MAVWGICSLERKQPSKIHDFLSYSESFNLFRPAEKLVHHYYHENKLFTASYVITYTEMLLKQENF
jgi:hypothetical protein